MTFELNSFAAIFFLATLLAGAVLVYTVQHLQVKGALHFAFLVISVTAWAFFQAFEFAVAEAAGKLLFARFQYFGIATIGVAWYLFAINYNRQENWFSRNPILLLVLPILTIFAAFTNDLHGWLWPQVTPLSNLPGANLDYAHGPAFWAIFIYNYFWLALGTITLIRTAVSSREIYRWQMVGLVVSALIPWVGNLIYVLELSPIPGLDLTPLGFTLSAITTAWSIFYLRLFDLVPIARDQLVENLVDGVIVLDRRDRVVDINPKALEFLGVQRENIAGREFLEVAGSWPNLAESFHEIHEIKTEIHLGPGTVNDLEVRISPLLDARKQPLGRLITLRDISQQKKLEHIRENLTQAAIHDLRNPLTSVVLALEMLRRQVTVTLPRDQLEILDASRQGAQRMLELVNSILDINRLENGEMPLNSKTVSLQELAGEAAKSISLLATRKRLLLYLDLPQGMPDLFVDPDLMRRVFQNLLDNAVKFSMEGGVVRVQAGFDRGDGAVLLSFSDTGNGIEPAVRANLFDKYISGNDKGSGSGLGLAFCRLVVEAHGGRIWLDETYQAGAKFCLTIPKRN